MSEFSETSLQYFGVYHFFCHPDPLKVGSRRVIQWAALIMILFGLFCKFGAVFVTIPTPIVGGLFMVMFGLVSAVGLSNLQVGMYSIKQNS